MVLDRARFDLAGVVHHAGQQRILGARAHEHQTAIGLNQSAVFYQAVEQALVDLHMDQAVAVEVERDGVARTQRHRAQRGGDAALVADLLAQQCHIATTGRVDRALVDDAGGAIAAE